MITPGEKVVFSDQDCFVHRLIESSYSSIRHDQRLHPFEFVTGYPFGYFIFNTPGYLWGKYYDKPGQIVSFGPGGLAPIKNNGHIKFYVTASHGLVLHAWFDQAGAAYEGHLYEGFQVFSDPKAPKPPPTSDKYIPGECDDCSKLWGGNLIMPKNAVKNSSDEFYARVQARIQKGVKFLDKKVPDWFERINTNTLVMSNIEFWIIAQVTGSDFGDGAHDLELNSKEIIDYGFDCNCSLIKFYRVAQDIWLKAIMQRRDTGKYDSTTSKEEDF